MARAERSLARHFVAYLEGDQDEDHMAAVVFNACVILDHEERIAAGELQARLDDRDEHRSKRISKSTDQKWFMPLKDTTPSN